MAPHVKNAVQGSERVTDDIDALAENLEVSKPFSYRVTFDAMPEFKWRGAFKGNKVKVAAAGDEASISAAAEAQFATAVKEKSKLLLVAAARPEQLTLQLGDVAVVDFDVTRTVDGGDEVRVPGAARAATQLDTATAEEALGLEGLVDGMVGMAVGAERAIPLTLPSNWMPEELAGAAVMARVKVRELLVWQLPEKVDDAWAEAAYPGSETVAVEPTVHSTQRPGVAPAAPSQCWPRPASQSPLTRQPPAQLNVSGSQWLPASQSPFPGRHWRQPPR